MTKGSLGKIEGNKNKEEKHDEEGLCFYYYNGVMVSKRFYGYNIVKY